MLKAMNADQTTRVQPTFSPQACEAELARLETQEAQQSVQQQQVILTNRVLEDVFELWQQGQPVSEIAQEQREMAMRSPTTPSEEAFLTAITASRLEERKFMCLATRAGVSTDRHRRLWGIAATSVRRLENRDPDLSRGS